MPVTRLTTATLQDIPYIQEIAEATWPMTFRQILTPDQISYMLSWMYSAESLRRQMEERQHIFLLARQVHVDAPAAGYASYELNSTEKATTKIHKLYVRPDAQGLGIGRTLLDAIRAAALNANQQLLTLNVNRYNRAIDFYERYGFSNVGTEVISIGNGYVMDDVIMEYHLKNGA